MTDQPLSAAVDGGFMQQKAAADAAERVAEHVIPGIETLDVLYNAGGLERLDDKLPEGLKSDRGPMLVPILLTALLLVGLAVAIAARNDGQAAR